MDPELTALTAEVSELRAGLLAAKGARSDTISSAHPSHQRSAVNLIHYVELRRHDLRELQTKLSMRGLSSFTQPAWVWLTATGAPLPEDVSGHGIVVVPVDDSTFVQGCLPGDRLELTDARGSQRHWHVIQVAAGGCLVSTEQTTYLTTGLQVRRGDPASERIDLTAVGELPRVEQVHRPRHLGHAGVGHARPNRTGVARRSDRCGHGRPAECVMLNKGPNITKAMRTLDSILRRMQEHQDKKRSRLRSWDRD